MPELPSTHLTLSLPNHDHHHHRHLLRCDTIPQCPLGEDEEGCHIPESARLAMSLFITLIIIVLILISNIIIITFYTAFYEGLLTFWATGTLSSPKIDIFIGSTIGSYYQNRYNDDCINAEGVAVLLTILTMLSTPILTAIFGDGSLEVCGHSPETKVLQTCFQPGGGYRGLGL